MAKIRAAFAEARKGGWEKAASDVSAVKNPVVEKILRWLDYVYSPTHASFAEISSFIRKNPRWPRQGTLRRHAEEAMASVPDAQAAAWFKQYPPLSFAGKVRAAEILISSGNAAAGTRALRQAWIDCDFGTADQRSFLARHGTAVRPQDNVKRLDRLLWDGRAGEARRMLPIVPPDYRALAEARLALAAKAPDAARLIGQVPPPLRTDPGLLYAELRYRSNMNMTDGAVAILLAEPTDPVRPALWWAERRNLARQVLAQGDPALAYRIVEEHGPIHGKALSEAEFLAGYIALRFMKNPALAFDHFSQILARAGTPYAAARAGYWGGRAAEDEGKLDLAQKWYAAGAEYMTTFYGQLAAHQLGRDAPPDPVPEPQPTTAERARFDRRELIQATRILFELGDAADAERFLFAAAKRAKSPLDFAMLASLAQAQRRTDLAIAVTRLALDAGMPLMVNGYPTIKLPPGGTAEPALLYAIIRQESGFDSDAESGVGARGLMQLMPATAKAVATRLGLPYSAPLLTSDRSYNVMLGRAYLQRLLNDFGGSYVLAIAAYNAGPGRVDQWLKQYGDPRAGKPDMVDWIEILPFNETRFYIQDVLENLQIYRVRDGAASAFSLVSDLAR